MSDLEDGKFKEILAKMNVCQTDAVIRRLEEEGFKHTFDRGHIFTRADA